MEKEKVFPIKEEPNYKSAYNLQDSEIFLYSRSESASNERAGIHAEAYAKDEFTANRVSDAIRSLERNSDALFSLKEESAKRKSISCSPEGLFPGREIVFDPSFDWSSILSDGYSSLRACLAMKFHGLPEKEEKRAELLRRLKTFSPAVDIPVYYEDLLEYSEAFARAYGIDVLKRAIEIGEIVGNNLISEAKEAAYRRMVIPKDVCEAILFAFPVKEKRQIRRSYPNVRPFLVKGSSGEETTLLAITSFEASEKAKALGVSPTQIFEEQFDWKV